MHIAVLIKEVLEYLDPKPGENFIDCTVGQGGHARTILEKTGPDGKILGIDQDPEQIEICRKNLLDFEERIILVNSSYTKLKEIVKEHNFKADGILLDLGMSSYHIDESGRGFSLKKDEPLDMRYNPEDTLTAKEIVNTYPVEEIERILREYGEERFAKKISEEIAKERGEIKSTFQLVEIIRRAIPSKFRQERIHFATRTFQALRIATNKELENIENVLPQLLEVLKENGRIAIISFHSLEDRIIKNFFRDKSKENILKILTKKPITVSFEEKKQNPRSRSAKLRVIIKN